MRRILYIFRSNLKNLELYHIINELEEFKENCHDFYLNMGIWYLENNYFDEVVVWRLKDKKSNLDSIIFYINNKKFIQKWVENFNEVFNCEPPLLSFFRGGFSEYDEITKKNPKFFGKKLYLAAGKRTLPQYGGIYDKILVEDEIDKINIKNSIPFYKTTNPNIFKPLNINKKEYSLCIISNFSQLRYKGTEFIISQINKDPYNFLKELKICHIGNNPKVGIELCKKYNVNNIEFLGSLERKEINEVLNRSVFGIVNSNREDGCPRVSAEILTSGTPLFINKETRLLNYYKEHGVVEFNTNTFLKDIITGYSKYIEIKENLISNLDRFNMNTICEMNYELWKQ